MSCKLEFQDHRKDIWNKAMSSCMCLVVQPHRHSNGRLVTGLNHLWVTSSVQCFTALYLMPDFIKFPYHTQRYGGSAAGIKSNGKHSGCHRCHWLHTHTSRLHLVMTLLTFRKCPTEPFCTVCSVKHCGTVAWWDAWHFHDVIMEMMDWTTDPLPSLDDKGFCQLVNHSEPRFVLLIHRYVFSSKIHTSSSTDRWKYGHRLHFWFMDVWCLPC